MIIAGREIGASESPYVIAEIGGAHNGLLDRALTLIEHAKRAGADAVKIQCFSPDTITFDGAGDEFVVRAGPWAGRRLYDLYRQTAMPREWYGALFDRARALEIPLIASVFSHEDIAWMEEFACPAYKLASFELVDHDLIQGIARTGKPLIMSTGMAAQGEIWEAWDAFVEAGGDRQQVAFLHCVSAYPTPADQANLRQLIDLHGRRGLSDHTLGIEAPIVAIALGAVIIEKHITISREDGGPDDHFATEPHEFAAMVTAIRRAHQMLQRPQGQTSQDEHRPLRRSLYVVADIRPGERFTRDNVRSIRPGNGLHPRHLPTVLDRISKVTVKAGTPMSLEFVEGV